MVASVEKFVMFRFEEWAKKKSYHKAGGFPCCLFPGGLLPESQRTAEPYISEDGAIHNHWWEDLKPYKLLFMLTRQYNNTVSR